MKVNLQRKILKCWNCKVVNYDRSWSWKLLLNKLWIVLVFIKTIAYRVYAVRSDSPSWPLGGGNSTVSWLSGDDELEKKGAWTWRRKRKTNYWVQSLVKMTDQKVKNVTSIPIDGFSNLRITSVWTFLMSVSNIQTSVSGFVVLACYICQLLVLFLYLQWMLDQFRL